MTSKIEGIPHEIRNWENGKGADVLLHMESETYFYYGNMKIPLGEACEIEVKRGEKDQKGKWEILHIQPIQSNPAIPMPKGGVVMPPKGIPGVPTGPTGAGQTQPQAVQMSYSKFEDLYSRGNEFQRRSSSIEHAVRLFSALFRSERDPKAAAMDVLLMAEILKDWLGKIN